MCGDYCHQDQLDGINLFNEDRRVFTRDTGLVGNPVTPCHVIRVYTKMNENFKGGIDNVMIKNNDFTDSRYHQQCADNGHRSLAHTLVRGKPIREKGRFGYLDSPVRDADWSAEYSVGVIPVGAIRIGYLRDPVDRSQSTDAAPLTELLIFYTLLHFYNCCSARSAWSWTLCNTVWNNICVEELTRRCSDFSVCQTMSGVALVDDRSGVTFDVELCIPWDAPEAMVDINSVEVVTLGSFPDKVGLFGRRKGAAVSRILQGRDSRSVRFLVPDTRGLDQNFHDVTIVDMDDEREPMVTPADMTRLRELWPPEIFNHMRWFQQDLELMRKSAKWFSQLRPMPCKFCGKVIRVDMYRHVARFHLDLVQLWRCPIAWCTTWKGSLQDCLEHLRNGHDVPWISKTASIEKYAPPWTVCCELWTDSLRVEHSGISTDILFFSKLGLSLKQHYRVYRGGLPHTVFRMDYMQRLRALLPSPRFAEGEPASPTDTGRGLTSKSARRLHRSSRPMRQMLEAVDDGPLLTVQNPAEMIGETVIDCRPSVLPVSIPLCSLSPATVAEAREISGCKPSQEPGRSIMDMDTSEITISRIVGFQWDDPGMDVEDELPAPVLWPVQNVAPVIPLTEAADLLDRGDGFDLDLAKVMLDVSVMPALISPIEECEMPPSSEAAGCAAPATPAVATVIESPGYSVPEDLTFTWVPEYVPVPEAVAVDEERQTRSPEHPSPNTVSASAVIPVVKYCDPRTVQYTNAVGH